MPRPLSRRTTLGTALAAPMVLAACELDPPPPAETSATPPPPADADLVASVVAALVQAEAVLATAAIDVPELGPRMQSVGLAHAAHRELLVGAVPEAALPTAAPVDLPTSPARALAAVRREEQQLLRTLRAACTTAASGDLARALASMAASTSQHLTSLAAGVRS